MSILLKEDVRRGRKRQSKGIPVKEKISWKAKRSTDAARNPSMKVDIEFQVIPTELLDAIFWNWILKEIPSWHNDYLSEEDEWDNHKGKEDYCEFGI